MGLKIWIALDVWIKSVDDHSSCLCNRSIRVRNMVEVRKTYSKEILTKSYKYTLSKQRGRSFLVFLYGSIRSILCYLFGDGKILEMSIHYSILFQPCLILATYRNIQRLHSCKLPKREFALVHCSSSTSRCDAGDTGATGALGTPWAALCIAVAAATARVRRYRKLCWTALRSFRVNEPRFTMRRISRPGPSGPWCHGERHTVVECSSDRRQPQISSSLPKTPRVSSAASRAMAAGRSGSVCSTKPQNGPACFSAHQGRSSTPSRTWTQPPEPPGPREPLGSSHATRIPAARLASSPHQPGTHLTSPLMPLTVFWSFKSTLTSPSNGWKIVSIRFPSSAAAVNALQLASGRYSQRFSEAYRNCHLDSGAQSILPTSWSH